VKGGVEGCEGGWRDVKEGMKGCEGGNGGM
jgi:hypothetical protein